MNLKEKLYIRLKILEDNNVINIEVTNYVKNVIDIILEEVPSITSEKAEMFLTHLAMASMRVINKEEENPLDENVLNSIRKEPNYEKAIKLLNKILQITNMQFSNIEKDFLLCHLCNIII